MSLVGDAYQAFKPQLFQAAAAGAKALFASPPPAAPQYGAPTAHADEHDGCPYCAAREHVWAAMGECLLARDATEPEVQRMFARRVNAQMERAFQACDVLEVVASADGAKVLAEIVRASADEGNDYDARARELFRIHSECVRLAGVRNAKRSA